MNEKYLTMADFRSKTQRDMMMTVRTKYQETISLSGVIHRCSSSIVWKIDVLEYILVNFEFLTSGPDDGRPSRQRGPLV